MGKSKIIWRDREEKDRRKQRRARDSVCGERENEREEGGWRESVRVESEREREEMEKE